MFPENFERVHTRLDQLAVVIYSNEIHMFFGRVGPGGSPYKNGSHSMQRFFQASPVHSAVEHWAAALIISSRY